LVFKLIKGGRPRGKSEGGVIQPGNCPIIYYQKGEVRKAVSAIKW